jgi:hypothetical protein
MRKINIIFGITVFIQLFSIQKLSACCRKTSIQENSSLIQNDSQYCRPSIFQALSTCCWKKTPQDDSHHWRASIFDDIYTPGKPNASQIAAFEDKIKRGKDAGFFPSDNSLLRASVTNNNKQSYTAALLEAGAKPDEQQEMTKTPLQIAAEKLDLISVISLIKHGASVNKKDANSFTPLYYAVNSTNEITHNKNHNDIKMLKNPVIEVLIKNNKSIKTPILMDPNYLGGM